MDDLTDDELRARLKHAMGERRLELFVAPLRELQTLRAAKAADAISVRQAVRDVIAMVSSLSGESYPQREIEDIATRLGVALASPQPADRASIIETVRNAVLHFRPDDYVLAEKVATVCARQLAAPAAPEPAPTSDRPRPGTFLAGPYSDDMCSWCGQARWNHNKSATSNLEGVVCPRRAETPLTSERVRQAVREIALETLVSRGLADEAWDDADFAAVIADRAAGQLSGVPGGLSEADRRVLDDLRIREQRAFEEIGHLGADVRAGIESTIATLDRLLGARP